MKALVLKEYNNLSYEDVPDPEYGPDDVLIRICACGICGSDIHGLDGSTGRRFPPIIIIKLSLPFLHGGRSVKGDRPTKLQAGHRQQVLPR